MMGPDGMKQVFPNTVVDIRDVVVRKVLAQYDTDKDNILSKEEAQLMAFESYSEVDLGAAEVRKRFAELFEKADENKDGYLDGLEIFDFAYNLTISKLPDDDSEDKGSNDKEPSSIAKYAAEIASNNAIKATEEETGP